MGVEENEEEWEDLVQGVLVVDSCLTISYRALPLFSPSLHMHTLSPSLAYVVLAHLSVDTDHHRVYSYELFLPAYIAFPSLKIHFEASLMSS